MTRPDFDEIYMNLAKGLAKRATCSRLQVGTVVVSVDYRKVLSIGYNGNAIGLHNKCDSDDVGGCGCLHSEENAIINCDAPRDTPKIIYVTYAPCVMCAKRLINLGNVQEVIYNDSYRLEDGLNLLKQQGIEARKHNDI